VPHTATNGVTDNRNVRADVWIPVFRMGSVEALGPSRGPRHVWDRYKAEQTRSKKYLKRFHDITPLLRDLCNERRDLCLTPR
jgi:hypothetical protein